MEALNHLIPNSIREIIEITDRQTAMALIDRFGGCKVYIPNAPMHGHKIVQVIGLTAAKQLAKRYGGNELHIPRCQLLTISIRNQKIQKARKSGLKTKEIAQEFRLSIRRVQEILRAKSGGELFEQVG